MNLRHGFTYLLNLYACEYMQECKSNFDLKLRKHEMCE